MEASAVARSEGPELILYGRNIPYGLMLATHVELKVSDTQIKDSGKNHGGLSKSNGLKTWTTEVLKVYCCLLLYTLTFDLTLAMRFS